MIFFDVVVFDLDGTLVDSAAMWTEATRRGIEEVYAKEGIRLPVLDGKRLRALIGTPAVPSLEALLPRERLPLVPEIAERVRRAGAEGVRRGELALYPGARECLEALRARGCRIAIATNSGARYRDECLDSLDLRRLVEAAYCLESPGVSNKVEMIAALLEECGTRRGVLVGDRHHDREAAHANGIPFVAFTGGYGNESEWDGAEARIETLADLVPLLEARGEVVGAIGEAILDRASGRRSPILVGVTGRLGAGKTLFADDLARWLLERGAQVEVLRLDDFGRPSAEPARPRPQGDHLAAAFDLEGFLRAVGFARRRSRIEGGGDLKVALVEGLFLLDERVRRTLDFVLHLEAETAVVVRRLASRGSAKAVHLAQAVYLPAQEAFRRAHPPARLADLVVDNSNPLRPRIASEGEGTL